MASGNFLTVKTHLSEFKNNSDKDTLSEASESGTSNSVTSAEDLQKLAVILGLNSAEDVYQERFRVDRRRLEAMLADNLDESQTAQAFFHRVMDDTNTLINWPARLKIGARSKKDPHVRIAGRADDVKLAREKIMQLLDTRSNRVTMKIDVSYTDHSHIIGKGGLTIKRVMEETGCHIHFPDSNRTSAMEKSNQVSIAGDMERVERARARVRALTPLVFCFELPIVHSSQPQPDIASPYVQQIQEQYKVQVMLRNRPKLHANLVVVKGVQWEVQATMEATTLLMNYMCGPLASQTQVQMTLEISPIHHSVVVGYNCSQLKVITKGTGAQIMFPDAADPNTPPIKKSCVTITGHIKDVYAARQQLVGSLPLVVIFDVADDYCRVDPDLANKLMHKYNVYINVRRKPKQGITSVIVRGIERCAGDIYEARRELLGGKEPSITAEIPESYLIHSPSAASGSVFQAFSPHSPCSPFTAAAQELANYAMNSPIYNNPPTPGGYPSPVSPAVGGGVGCGPYVWGGGGGGGGGGGAPSPAAAAHPHQLPFPYPAPHPHTHIYTTHASWNPMSSTVEMQQPMLGPPFPQPPVENRPTNTLSQILNSSAQASSGYQSNFTGSCMSLDTQNISGGEVSNVVSPSVSPISAAHSPPHPPHPPHPPQPPHQPHPPQQPSQQPATTTATATANPLTQCSVNELANIMAELPLSDRRAPGCEKKTLETLNKMSPLSEYNSMKAEANKAMRENVGSSYRVPTPRWAGYYFSHTSPSAINLKSESNAANAATDGMATPEKGWSRPELTRPNIVECVATPPRGRPVPCRYQQLYDLMRDVGLHKYIDLFKKHELDMSTFASMTSADLAEIGVAAFGARKKMLLIITELQKQRAAFNNSPAGGDRKVITSPPYNTANLAQDKW